MLLANLLFAVWIVIPESASLMNAEWLVVNAPHSTKATVVNVTAVLVSVATREFVTLICSVSTQKIDSFSVHFLIYLFCSSSF
jgi:hypothetical protein